MIRNRNLEVIKLCRSEVAYTLFTHALLGLFKTLRILGSFGLIFVKGHFKQWQK